MVIPEELYSQGTKSEVSSLEQTLLVGRIIFILKAVAVCFSDVGAVLLYVCPGGTRGHWAQPGRRQNLLLDLSQGPIPVAYSITQKSGVSQQVEKLLYCYFPSQPAEKNLKSIKMAGIEKETEVQIYFEKYFIRSFLSPSPGGGLDTVQEAALKPCLTSQLGASAFKC